ncbi:MAG: peptide deformylase, partial [Acidimicrobiia bacterium]|nr:peptide deformylase [Acidimicrobiia bacterium]
MRGRYPTDEIPRWLPARRSARFAGRSAPAPVARRRAPSASAALASLEGVEIRLFGDPVLRSKAAEVTQIDGSVARLCDGMFTTMYAARGIGLAAPQVGVRKRLFVYDEPETCGRGVILNPVLADSDGTWMFEEGCLSVPGYSWQIERPRRVALSGIDLNGNEVTVEADDLFARLIQHEIDHLDGVLLTERLD